MPRRLLWLSVGNTKLGLKTPKFSLPTGYPQHGGTCPGASRWCAGNPASPTERGSCYADHRRPQGWNKRPVVREKRERNLAALVAPGGYDRFVAEITQDLATLKATTCRIHDSGDLFAPEYIRAWVRIAQANPRVKFWTYTHSWRVAALVGELHVLQAQPNVQLFASVDPRRRASRRLVGAWPASKAGQYRD